MLISLFGSAALSVAQIAAPQADTLYVRQIASHQTTLEKVSDISIILVALMLIALLGSLLYGFLQARKAQKRAEDFVKGLRNDLAPTLNAVNEVSLSISSATSVVKRQITSAEGTFEQANDALRDALDRLHHRVRDFDALLKVAQEEAEDIFLNAASTMRGVRRGAAAFGDGRRGGRGRRRIRETDVEIERELPLEYDSLWDDEIERVVEAEPRTGDDHPISAEQGPTVHRRRARTRGPR